MIINQTLSFASGSERLYGYLSQPDQAGPLPGLIIIHEAFGMNEDIRGITQRFAHAGYVSLAVDLFTGRNQPVCMARFMYGIFRNSYDHQGIHDLKSALSYLCSLPQVDADHVGAVGYCMGGSFAVAWACTDNRLKAVAPHYGFNPRPSEALRRACPIVGSYPDKDFTTKQGQQLDLMLDEYGVPHDIKIYENTAHSFANKGRMFNPDAADDAFERVLAFFNTHVIG